jgi:hypothetical protein
VLAAEVEDLPVIGERERSHTLAELWMKNGVVLEHEQRRRPPPLRLADEKTKREAVRAAGSVLESAWVAERLRIDSANPLGGHARVGHAGLEPGPAILPTRETDEGAMRKDGVEVHAVRGASTARKTLR